MKKLISIFTVLTMIATLAISQEVQNDVTDEVDVDVDVIVEAEDVAVTPVTTDEILNIIAQKLNKNPKLTEEQKQKILEMIQQKLQNKEIPQIQLCVEVCKQAEIKWRKGSDVEVCKKDIENIEKKIKEDVEEAQKRLEKTFRKREHLRAHLQQAKEVLQKLVENGIPVQHALDVVTSIPPKENLNVSAEVKAKLEEKLNKGESIIPNVLPEELKNRLQLRIREDLEKCFQYQQQRSFEVQIQQQTQNTGEVNEITTQQQEYLGGEIQMQNPVDSEQIIMQYQQLLDQYKQMNKTDTSQQSGGCK